MDRGNGDLSPKQIQVHTVDQWEGWDLTTRLPGFRVSTLSLPAFCFCEDLEMCSCKQCAQNSIHETFTVAPSCPWYFYFLILLSFFLPFFFLNLPYKIEVSSSSQSSSQRYFRTYANDWCTLVSGRCEWGGRVWCPFENRMRICRLVLGLE